MGLFGELGSRLRERKRVIGAQSWLPLLSCWPASWPAPGPVPRKAPAPRPVTTSAPQPNNPPKPGAS